MVDLETSLDIYILTDSENSTEVLNSSLRNRGLNAHVYPLQRFSSISDTLNDKKVDILVLSVTDFGDDIKAGVTMIHDIKQYLPIIVFATPEQAQTRHEIMAQGVSDVVIYEDWNMLAEVIIRDVEYVMMTRAFFSQKQHMLELEQRNHLLLNTSKEAIAYIQDGFHTYANEAYYQLLKIKDPDALTSLPFVDIWGEEAVDTVKGELKKVESNADDLHQFSGTLAYNRKNPLKVDVMMTQVSYDGESCVQAIIQKPNHHEGLREKLKQLTSQDLLTGLHNRQFFIDRLNHMSEHFDTEMDSCHILYCQINDFQELKSGTGITGADIILNDIAQIMKKYFNKDHVLARLSDDVFAVIYYESSQEVAKLLCQEILREIDNHLFEVSKKTIAVRCSIGIVKIDKMPTDAQTVLNMSVSAQEKAYRSNTEGSSMALYQLTRADEKATSDNKNLIAQIQLALQENRFIIHFQPIISLQGTTTEHYEVLIRMKDEAGTIVPPSIFMPVAYRTEFGAKLDRWIILKSIRALSTHRAKGHNTRLFINLTPNSLQDPSLLPWLNIALRAARLPADSLIFQLAESDAAQYLKQAKQFSTGLSNLNCKMAISHFAAENFEASAKILTHIDVEFIKFDPTLSSKINKPEIQEALKAWLIDRRIQNQQTIMPNIEDPNNLAFIWQTQINFIQGYYLQAPSEQMDYDFSGEA